MQRTNKAITPLIFIASALCAYAQLDTSKTSYQQERSLNTIIIEKQSAASVAEVAQLIESCPDWISIPIDDSSTKERIFECLGKIAQFDYSTIRSGVEKYLAGITLEDANYISKVGRIFLLNRYLFNVLPNTLSNQPRFGGWIGISGEKNNREVDMLWPLSLDNNRNLVLTGRVVTYLGPPYQALDEFDFFSKKFGLRKLPRGKR